MPLLKDIHGAQRVNHACSPTIRAKINLFSPIDEKHGAEGVVTNPGRSISEVLTLCDVTKG